MNSNSYIVTDQQRQLDLEMVPYDIWGTQAHVTMLHQIGVLSAEELHQILSALHTIEARVQAGHYEIDPNLGAHLTLEREITALVGPEAGGKVHTGRSRNDQVITAQKLYVREKVLETGQTLLALIEGLVELAAAHVDTIMPGYTHTQPAKPTTFGQWCLAYADMFFRDLERLTESYTRHNTNPLGAAESYGTSWPLDRALTATLMGFPSVQEIPLDVVASRGEMEAEILSDLSFVQLHLSKMAQDLLLLNTFEFGMIELSQGTAQRMGKVTGSSIMPQKKNPDVLELLRANASVVFSYLFQALELLKALPFGYNRDARETKEAVILGIRRSQESLIQAQRVLTTLHVNTERMYQAVIENYSLATELADALARDFHLPYRQVYLIVGRVVEHAINQDKPLSALSPAEINQIAQQEAGVSLALTPEALGAALDPHRCIARRQHIGGAAAEQMTTLITHRRQRLQAHQAWLERQTQQSIQARAQLAQPLIAR